MAAKHPFEREVKWTDGGKAVQAPVWRALKAYAQASKAGQQKLLRELKAQLTVPERLAVLERVAAGGRGVVSSTLDDPELPWIGVKELTKAALPEATAWAARWADALAAEADALLARPPALFRWIDWPNAGMRLTIFELLIAAGAPLEPRWDVLLPFTDGTSDRLTARINAIVQALPASRRGALHVAALRRRGLLQASFLVSTLRQGVPTPEVAELALDAIATDKDPAFWMTELHKQASPVVAAALVKRGLQKA